MTTSNFTLIKHTDRTEWLAARKHGIGASEAAQLATIDGIPISNWGSPFSLYQEKVSPPKNEPTTERQMIWGTILEPGIRQVVADRLGQEISHEPWGIHWKEPSEDDPRFQFASLDGWIDDPCPPETGTELLQELFEYDERITGPGVIELKSDARPPWDKPPLVYMIQVQHQLSVTGWKWGILGVFFSIDQSIRLYPIVRDDTMIRKLNRTELSFWRNHVLAKTPPPPDGTDATRRALAELYDDPTDEAIDLADDMSDTIERLEDAKARRKEIDERIALMENQLKAAMGNHTIGFTAAGYRVTWKQQTRKEHIVKESTFRVLRVKMP